MSDFFSTEKVNRKENKVESNIFDDFSALGREGAIYVLINSVNANIEVNYRQRRKLSLEFRLPIMYW